MSARAKVLVVAAHPDDEVLGCGGVIARHVDAGDSVDIVLMAEGITSREAAGNASTEHQRDALRVAAVSAAEILGARTPRFVGLPDNRMDALDLLDIVKQVESVVAEVDPEIIYTHHAFDLNIDHRLTHQAVLTACRPFVGNNVRSIYSFEVLSSTEWSTPVAGQAFVPIRFADISATLTRKLEAMECYASEIREFPHPRSREAIVALAKLRGATAGLEAAEAFVPIREVVL